MGLLTGKVIKTSRFRVTGNFASGSSIRMLRERSERRMLSSAKGQEGMEIDKTNEVLGKEVVLQKGPVRHGPLDWRSSYE